MLVLCCLTPEIQIMFITWAYKASDMQANHKIADCWHISTGPASCSKTPDVLGKYNSLRLSIRILEKTSFKIRTPLSFRWDWIKHLWCSNHIKWRVRHKEQFNLSLTVDCKAHCVLQPLLTFSHAHRSAHITFETLHEYMSPLNSNVGQKNPRWSPPEWSAPKLKELGDVMW